jgi:type VI secretion system protein ImpF
MPRPPADQKLVLSVLDRMIDDRPHAAREAPDAVPRSLVQVKEAVKRDLEWLLNSRQVVADLPDDLRQLDRSLVTYGLPDFTAASFSHVGDQDLLRRSVEEAIRRFEPRFSRVRVTLEAGRENDRSVRFRIDALLNIEPEPEPITFDSVLHLNTKTFVVSNE